jgi:type II secretion system protein G
VGALKRYKLDNQNYPSAEQGLEALVRKPTAGPIPPNWKPYLDKLPADPWGRPYQYVNPGVKGEIDVFSYGADGVRPEAKARMPTSAAGSSADFARTPPAASR